MPERKTIARARADKRSGKAASTQAGAFVKEEIDRIRQGAHGARSSKQAIAIGLSKARRAGVDLKPPSTKKTSATTRQHAARDRARGHGAIKLRPVSAKRSQAATGALQREGTAAATPLALARHARKAARARGPTERSKAARKAARTRSAQLH